MMKMSYKKKKYAVILLAIALCMSMPAFTSCGKEAEGGKSSNEVYVYCYGDYFDQDIMKEFTEETGIKVVLDTYDTAEEMYTVVTNGANDYDCICTSDYIIEKLANEGYLAELDYSNIPEVKNIGDIYMKKSEDFDPGNKYSVPYAVGVAGIAYNKNLVGDEEIDSWADMWNKRFKEDMVMPDSVREAMMIGLLKNGYSINSVDEAELEKASDDLVKQKPLVYKYANDAARDLVVDGSAALGMVWNGEYAYMKDLNPDIEFVIPKEGTEFFIDSWIIPKSDKCNKANAEAWINFICKKEIAYTNFDYLYYTTPNEAAIELIDEETLSNEAIFPKEETIARCSSLKSMSTEDMKLYSRCWKKVKAA